MSVAGRDPGFLGADPDELERVAASIASFAETIHRHRLSLNGLLHSVPWLGAVADDFRRDWASMHLPRLGEAVEALERVKKALLDRAQAQRQASAPDKSGDSAGIVISTNGSGVPLQGSSGAGLQGGDGAMLQGSDGGLLQGSSAVLIGAGTLAGVASRAAAAQKTAPAPAPAPAVPPQWAVNGPQDYSAKAAIAKAEAEERAHTLFPKTVNGQAFNAPGQCMVAVARWVREAGGTYHGCGEHGGPLVGVGSSGERLGVVTPETVAYLRPGDVLQRVETADNTSWDNVHTVMVTANNHGSLSIIQSNYETEPGQPNMTYVSSDTSWSLTAQTKPGTEWIAYRLAGRP